MSPLRRKLRKQLDVRPRFLAGSLFALIILAIGPVFGESAQEVGRYVIVYDDIGNSVNVAAGDIELPAGLELPGDIPRQGASGGHDNNGHGNNDDGVDSSNPGQGIGGPNGREDGSCDGSGDCIDDESGSGHNGRG